MSFRNEILYLDNFGWCEQYFIKLGTYGDSTDTKKGRLEPKRGILVREQDQFWAHTIEETDSPKLNVSQELIFWICSLAIDTINFRRQENAM